MGWREKRESLQWSLDIEGGENEGVYFFEKGVVIWPSRGRRGVADHGFNAQKKPGQKVKGLQAFEAKSAVTLYLDGDYRTLSEGSRFGAYTKNARKIS